MIIRQAYPPNYTAILAAFPWVRGTRGVIFCYGDTIFSPGGKEVHPALIAHESVHAAQQTEWGATGPEGWWDNYLHSAKFRFEQEVPAHITELQWWTKAGMPRNARRAALVGIASRLSGPLYGKLISKEKAKRLLRDALTSPSDEPMSDEWAGRKGGQTAGNDELASSLVPGTI